MVANKSGLQRGTMRNIALAWLLTLPVSIVLAGALFLVLPRHHPRRTTRRRARPSCTSIRPATPPASRPCPAKPLRLHGSNTIGAELAPALAMGFLKKLGGSEVTRDKDAAGHAWVVTASSPGNRIADRGRHRRRPDRHRVRRPCASASATSVWLRASSPKRRPRGSRPRASATCARPTPRTSSVSTASLSSSTPRPHPQLSPRMTCSRACSTARPLPAVGDAPFQLYARDDSSGTYDTFKNLVLGSSRSSPAPGD